MNRARGACKGYRATPRGKRTALHTKRRDAEFTVNAGTAGFSTELERRVSGTVAGECTLDGTADEEVYETEFRASYFLLQ